MKKLFYISLMFLLAGISFAQPKDILINWECNMEIEILSGRFNLADTVAARGNFNGWGRHDLVVSIDPNIYVSAEQDTVLQASVGDTILAYKFFYTPNTWEGGGDKLYILTQDDYDNGEATVSRPFNDGTLSTVTNQPTDILFQIDCSLNPISAINNLPFPEINTVHLAGGTQPLQWPDLGWPDAQINLMIPLFDDGTNGDKTAGDLVFSTTVTFPAYTVFLVSYKFGINYGDAVNNGGGNDNENAIGANHQFNLFPTAYYAETLDTFGIMGLKDFTVDVKDITQTLPTAYSLDQNYPNPFNPATIINFSIPNEGFVTLSVYNSIGQIVATLVNESKPAGTYEVDFVAEGLTSGIYFYQITSGNFSETKKMMLLK